MSALVPKHPRGFTDKNWSYTDKSGSYVVIDKDHHEIHEGESYFHSDFYTVAASGSLNFVFQIDGKNLHYIYTINSDQAGYTFVTFEGVTSDNNGTLITPRNHNREYADASTGVLRLNPTNIVTTGATQLRRGYAGTATNPAQRTGGSVIRTSEVILKKNTKYLLRITNLSSSVTNDIQVGMDWYEE